VRPRANDVSERGLNTIYVKTPEKIFIATRLHTWKDNIAKNV